MVFDSVLRRQHTRPNHDGLRNESERINRKKDWTLATTQHVDNVAGYDVNLHFRRP